MTSPKETTRGFITIRNLRLTLPIGLDAWDRASKPQPVVINIRIQHEDIRPAAQSDDCRQTISYSDVAKAAIKAHESVLTSSDNTIEHAHATLFEDRTWLQGARTIDIETYLPKGSLRTEGGYAVKSVVDLSAATASPQLTDIFRDLKLACVIGVNAHEREQKQMVVINLELQRYDSGPGRWTSAHRQRSSIIQALVERIERSTFETVEALALSLSDLISREETWSEAVIRVEKPSAIALADGSGVELHESYKKPN